ncbi:unnamed protein product, partial [Polarella glacialis]
EAAPRLPSVKEGSQREEGSGRGRGFRLLSFLLRVSPDHGAGLDLEPERGGMRVEKVYDEPGQPGVLSQDLITKISEVSLQGNPDRVEAMFGKHFADGVEITVRRSQ